jgi:uncharacterized protein (TIGR02145 family)
MKIIQHICLGKLYNWYAVAGITVASDPPQAEDYKKTISPTGWHVPDGEWTTLTFFRR